MLANSVHSDHNLFSDEFVNLLIQDLFLFLVFSPNCQVVYNFLSKLALKFVLVYAELHLQFHLRKVYTSPFKII